MADLSASAQSLTLNGGFLEIPNGGNAEGGNRLIVPGQIDLTNNSVLAINLGGRLDAGDISNEHSTLVTVGIANFGNLFSNGSNFFVGGGAATATGAVQGSFSNFQLLDGARLLQNGAIARVRLETFDAALTENINAPFLVDSGSEFASTAPNSRLEIGGSAVLTVSGLIGGDTPSGRLGFDNIVLGEKTVLAVGRSNDGFALRANPLGNGTLITEPGSDTIVTGNIGANVLILNRGTLHIGDGGTSGSITPAILQGGINPNAYNLVNAGALVFNRRDDLTLNEYFCGDGALVKQGAGTVTLAAVLGSAENVALPGASRNACQYQIMAFSEINGRVERGLPILTAYGPVDDAVSLPSGIFVNEGRLLINRVLPATTTINAGGTLGGTGTVGAVTVQSGGTLAAGNSIGTLNTGDVTLNAGSVLAVEVDPSDATRADLINATGNVTINGATLRHVGEAGTYVPDRTWRIITATGTVTGTFGAVASDYTFLTPTAIYGANFVNLRLLRNDVSFESVARTRNQRNTARGIGTIAGSDAANALLTLSGDAARNALDQFSGAGLAAIGAGQLGEGQSIVTTLTGQMGGAGGDGGGGGGEGGSIVTASSRGGQGTPSGLWANLYGDGSSRSLDGITTDLRNAGLILGHDLRFGAWDGGVFIGRGQSQSDTAALGTRATTQSLSLGTYANRRFGEMDLSLGLIGTWGDVQSTRTVAVGALNQTLSANYSTRMLTGFAEMARRYEGAVWSATPFARLTQQWLHNDGFTETGGTAALTRGAETTTQTLLTLGAELERPLGAGRFSANAALTQSFGGAAEATYRLGNSTPFTVEGDAPRDTSLDLGLGYEIPLSNTATLAANATRQGNATTRRFGLNFGLRF
ncbi:autotransporter domain-containing protein [Rhodobacteraceae bacterium XHP0102]|nr:autotransporter domain-containing protein [Rhodobacteraceae bacterium XHP0102]